MTPFKHPIQPDLRNVDRTICEVIREIYRSAREQNDAATMRRCDEAHDMAKRMNTKLVAYKAQYGAGLVDEAKARVATILSGETGMSRFAAGVLADRIVETVFRPRVVEKPANSGA